MTTTVLKKCAKCGVDISVVGVTYTFNGDCFCVRCLPVTGMMEIPMTHSEALKEEVKLKPCPFCGGGATMERACLVRDTYYWVTCHNERCSVRCHGFQSLTERDAIAAWNRRAPVAAPPSDELVKRLESWERFFEELPEFHEDIRQALALISSQSAALEAQANQIKEMREALEDLTGTVDAYNWADDDYTIYMSLGRLRRARSVRGS